MKFNKLQESTARQLVEYYVLNQEALKEDRNFKYKLGRVVGERLLSPSKRLKK